MIETFFVVVFVDLALSVGLVIHFWRLAPGVSLALAGGIAGAITAFVGWLFAPENLQAVDVLDGGLLKSFGDGLPAAARGFSIGLVVLGFVSFGLGRPPQASPRYLRRAATASIGAGVALAVFTRHLLIASCRSRPMDFCSDGWMVTVAVVFAAVTIALMLLALAPSGRTTSNGSARGPFAYGAAPGDDPTRWRTARPGY
jgi:hypothetical protein